jgi:dipeptidyl aminopeptidase/acylaminoacyl peptidase
MASLSRNYSNFAKRGLFMKRFAAVICVLVITLSLNAAGQTARAERGSFGFAEMMKARRVGDPRVSPDGRRVAFTIGDVDFNGNRVVTQIYVMPVGGGEMKQLTSGDRSATAPRWSPDGKKIAYVTGSQIWKMDDDGDDKEQVTKISTGAAGPVWSPDGKWIAFVSEVHPECSNDDCNKRKDEAAEKSKVKARMTDRLLFRHWVEWRNEKRSHLFIVAANGGEARDLTPGDFDAPPYAAAGDVDYSFAPDGARLPIYGIQTEWRPSRRTVTSMLYR